MTDTNVFQLSQPGPFADPLTEVLRNGARALLTQAVEAEVAALLSCHADKLTDDGRQRLVRHGHLPEREIVTGVGPVAVRCPRVRDRSGTGEDRIRFTSAILPPYARRSKSLDVLIPILYLKGISTGDFEEALAALLGKDSGGLSASTIGRLKDAWWDEHVRWSKRDLCTLAQIGPPHPSDSIMGGPRSADPEEKREPCERHPKTPIDGRKSEVLDIERPNREEKACSRSPCALPTIASDLRIPPPDRFADLGGASAPEGTPAQIIDKLNKEINAALAELPQPLQGPAMEI